MRPNSRWLAVSLIAAALTASLPAGARADHQIPREEPASRWMQAQNARPHIPCLRRSWIPRTGMPVAERRWRFIRLVRCATFRWWPGHASDVLGVAAREGGYNPYAYNPTGCNGAGCLGAFQHHASYWPGRRDAFLRRDWFKAWPVPWWNARAQVIVTVRMMAAQGICPAWC